jgi:hypothetical protein
MAIKLIVLDVDATLIDSPKERLVSQPVKDAITAAIEKGIIVSIASGRNYALIQDYVLDLKITGPCICCNGAVILDDEQIYYQKDIHPKTVTFCLQFAKEHHLMVAIFDGYHSYLVSSDHSLKHQNRKETDHVTMARCNFDEYPGLCTGDVYTLSFVSESYGDMERSFKKFLGLAETGALPQEVEVEISQASSHLNVFSVTAKDVNKGSSLVELAKIYGLRKEEIMAIGDSENDLAMIKMAGIGVAMGNGLQILKDCADYVAPSVCEDGVAEAIERFAL